jgi:hypothetical protein
MGYGCKIWDQYGSVMLDTTDYTARLIYSDIKSGSSSGSTYLSAADGTMPIVLTAPGPNNTGQNLLKTSITPTGTLSWSPVYSWNGSVSSGETIILVFVCDERV